MTGNLNLMMSLRNRELKDANVAVAESVGRMAELGWFDVEFTMYGCVYLDETLEKRYYKVSTQAEDIYSFIESSVCNGVYPSNVMRMTKKCAVPSGMKELLAQDVKKELAKKLSEVYSIDFLTELTTFAMSCGSDDAAELLWQQADALEGVFDEEKLRLLGEQVQYAYSCRKLEDTSYEKLLAWIKEEYKSMDDMLTKKDMFEKTLYGIAYEDNGMLKYMENAQKDYIYENMHALEQQGIFVTPVYSKTYWYNYEYRLMDVKRDFKKDLREVCSAEYCKQIEVMRANTAENSKKIFAAMLESAEGNWGRDAAKTLQRYGHRWNMVE